jgi:hypothetical protein
MIAVFLANCVGDPKKAMATAAKLVQDDLVIMVEEDGKPPTYLNRRS